MTRYFKAVLLCMGLAVPSFMLSPLAVAKTKPTPPAPKPAQILAAKKVFVANGGGDEPFSEDPLFSGGPDRAYNQFYAAVKTSGQYELVASPSDADLLIEIRFSFSNLPRERNETRTENIFGDDPYDSLFRLEIRDPKTNALLWAFTEHVQWAILQGNRDKNFDQALSRVVNDVQGLSVSAAALNKP
jgi:hypothetical protein